MNTEDRIKTEQMVRETIVEQLGVDSSQVIPSAKFIEDLGADSLDTVELVMAFEEQFNAEIPDADAEKIQTVGDALNLACAIVDGTYITGSWQPTQKSVPEPTLEEQARAAALEYRQRRFYRIARCLAGLEQNAITVHSMTFTKMQERGVLEKNKTAKPGQPVYLFRGTEMWIDDSTVPLNDADLETLLAGVPSQKGHERFNVADAIATEILIERGRQIREEGYTPEGDDAAYLYQPREKQGQLAYAAGAYAGGAGCIINGSAPRGVFEMWPWDRNLMKIDSARKMLIKSAALAIAQIEQIDRVAAGETKLEMRTGTTTKELIENSGAHGEKTTAIEPRIEKYWPGIAGKHDLPDVTQYPVGTTYRGWIVIELPGSSEFPTSKGWELLKPGIKSPMTERTERTNRAPGFGTAHVREFSERPGRRDRTDIAHNEPDNNRRQNSE